MSEVYNVLGQVSFYRSQSVAVGAIRQASACAIARYEANEVLGQKQPDVQTSFGPLSTLI